MSSFTGGIERLRDLVDKVVKEVSDLIASCLSKLSEIEGRLESEVDRGRLLGELGELRNLRHKVKSEAMRARHELRRSLREVRNEIRLGMASGGGSGEMFEEAEGKLEEAEGYLEEKLDEIGEKLDSFSERVEEVEERLKDKIKDWRRGLRDFRRPFAGGFAFPEVRWPDIKIPDVGKIIDESLSKAWTGVPSAIVSSVRLPQADLNLIDTLVNSGVFRSRNEGIAFFAHRGIEASKEWLTKVKEKLDEIRKLQEETKMEIDKVIGESASTAEEKGKESEKE
ncbi:MAG: hypothetical protein JTT11_10380 [Candidatus Brockarchaeota archaeon]|nr:hypothetical protein [Candidatus Brockarchaeota archaeon]